MKKLIAGPWCGEFGWEVMTWQPYLRAVASDYDYIVVCIPPGHDVMYEFASSYLHYDAPTEEANMWMNDAHDEKAYREISMLLGLDESKVEWLTPSTVWQPLTHLNKWEKLIGLEPRKFHPLGKSGSTDGYDVVYHARHRNDWDSGFRNWEPEHCKEFIRRCKVKVACIGRTGRAHYCGGDDLRDIPLEQLANVLANSKVLVGPISGPIHFGALCGTPTVTWATKKEHMERVQTKWNPFMTPVAVHCADDSVWKNRTPWTPEIDKIQELIDEVISVKADLSIRCA